MAEQNEQSDPCQQVPSQDPVERRNGDLADDGGVNGLEHRHQHHRADGAQREVPPFFHTASTKNGEFTAMKMTPKGTSME